MHSSLPCCCKWNGYMNECFVLKILKNINETKKNYKGIAGKGIFNPALKNHRFCIISIWGNIKCI